MKKKTKKKQGFTLLELLVVVVIIGILVGIALPQYQLAAAKARFATIKNAGESIAKSVQMFYLMHDLPPETLEDLDIEIPGTLSENKKRIYIDTAKNTYCSISQQSSVHKEIECFIRNPESMSYLIGVYYKGDIGRVCRPHTLDTNTVMHKLCQQETKLSEPSNCSEKNNYCNYQY